MVIENRSEILLESGTNEIEIMEFTIGGNVLGINVSKVSEIMMPFPVTPMPNAHPAVEGVFKPRDIVITVINLPKYLGYTESAEDEGKDLFIHTNFNKMHVAFRVHTVVGIDRISWQAIQKPDVTIYGGAEGVVTGLAECEGRLVTILDFEKIVADISPASSIQLKDLEILGPRERNEHSLVMAEDSFMLTEMILESLHTAGYVNIKKFNNGQETWDYLTSIKGDSDIYKKVSLVMTDIEMPKMDGHHLTKLIKSDPVLEKIPVIIFSSLIDEQMRLKGIEVGADEQLTKPEILNLVQTIDKLVTRNDSLARDEP